MTAWVAAGQPVAAFYRATPAEVAIACEADRLRRRADNGGLYTLAQLTRWAVHKPDKMPGFDQVFPGRARPRVQSPEEMRAIFDAMAAARPN